MKNPQLVAMLAAVGALAGGLYVYNSWSSLRRQAYRATVAGAGAVNLEVPEYLRALMIPEQRHMPQFSVQNPFTLPGVGGTGGAGVRPGPDDWMVDTRQYHDTYAMLTGSSPSTGTTAPSSSNGTATFGVRAPTL